MENENIKDVQNQNGVDQNTTGTAGNSGEDNSANTQQQQNNQQQNNQQSSGDNTGTGKTFTQEDVNRMMTAEKNQGRAAAFREMGIDPNDVSAMNTFKAFMQAMNQGKDTDQGAQQQIKLAEAESRAKKAEAKAEAMQLGVDPQYVDDAVVIIMSKLDDTNDVKTLVGELKTKYPIWFKGSGEQDNGGQGTQGNQNQGGGSNTQAGQKGTGSSVGNAGKKNGEGAAAGIGARLAAQKKQNNGKSSGLWN